MISDIFEIDKANFRVVYNGFESDLLQYRDKKFNKSHKLPVDWKDYILCIANIETRKNQHLLIEAAKLSKKDFY